MENQKTFLAEIQPLSIAIQTVTSKKIVYLPTRVSNLLKRLHE